MDEKVCDNCRWRDFWTGVCVNGYSEHCADYVNLEDSCKWWEPEFRRNDDGTIR